MRYLEIRRHTMRNKPGKHLSQAGVNLARQVGEKLGPFDQVITSKLPRAFETAIAMGFAVEVRYAELNTIDEAIENEIDWAAGFAEFAQIIRQGGITARAAHQQAAFWQKLALAVPENGCALLISHGSIIEAGTIGCLPDLDYSNWGKPCDYCEGVLLGFEGNRFITGELLRLKKEENEPERKA